MKVFIFNETSDVINIKLDGGCHILNSGSAITVSIEKNRKICIDNDIVIQARKDSLNIFDDNARVSGLGGEFLGQYKVPDGVDYAFTVFPVGEGDGAVEKFQERVVHVLASLGYSVVEMENGASVATSASGAKLTLFPVDEGITFKIVYAARKIAGKDVPSLLDCLNSFNFNSVVAKAFCLLGKTPAICLESWMGINLSNAAIERFVLKYFQEASVQFDDKLKATLFSFMAR